MQDVHFVASIVFLILMRQKQQRYIFNKCQYLHVGITYQGELVNDTIGNLRQGKYRVLHVQASTLYLFMLQSATYTKYFALTCHNICIRFKICYILDSRITIEICEPIRSTTPLGISPIFKLKSTLKLIRTHVFCRCYEAIESFEGNVVMWNQLGNLQSPELFFIMDV